MKREPESKLLVDIGGHMVADDDHLQHLDLIPGEQGNNEVVPWSPALVGDCALREWRRGLLRHSKGMLCCGRCRKRTKTDLCQGRYRPTT